MHIYEVVPLRDGVAFNYIDSDVVVAKSPESAVRLIVNRYNEAGALNVTRKVTLKRVVQLNRRNSVRRQ